MTHSLAQRDQAPCPACGQGVDLEIWLIVDLAERPDLAERVREGRIHVVPCPHCGQEGGVDAPLLVHDPERKRVWFAPPQGTSQEQDQQLAGQLARRLAETFLHPRPAYLGQVMTVPQETLPALLDADDPQAVLEELTRQEAGEDPLLRAVQALIQARSPAQVSQTVQAYPILLTDEAGAMMRQGIESARRMGQGEMARHIEERYEALRQMREKNQSGTTTTRDTRAVAGC